MNSKLKGKRGELELAKILRGYGFSARRGVQYKGGQDSPDVLGLEGIHIECKRVEKLFLEEAMDQSIEDSGKDMPSVMHRKNGRPWLVTMRLEDWIVIYEGWRRWESIKDII